MRSTATAHQLLAARPRSRAFVDVAIAATALVAALGQLSDEGSGASRHGSEGLDWGVALLAVCSTAPIVVWRHAPRAVFAFTAASVALLGALGDSILLPLGPTAALFLFAASRDEDNPWTRGDTALVVAIVIAYLVATGLGDAAFPGSELLHTGLAWSAAWFAGDRTRLRREHLADLSARAERAEREGERERRLAVAEERARIARDLHDSAGHAINVIAVRAGAARMRREPERSQAALEAIEDLARRTGGEIDQIVGTLRDRGGANEAVDDPPGLASLPTLVGRHAAAGLEVDVTTRGEPRRLERTVDQAAYRIMQEALTNSARHGSGDAKIEIAFGENEVELKVSNAAIGEATPRSNGGHGLVGMRERASLLGGSLDAERTDSAFRVRARLPYAGPTR